MVAIAGDAPQPVLLATIVPAQGHAQGQGRVGFVLPFIQPDQGFANPSDPGFTGQTAGEDPDELVWVPDGRLYRLHQNNATVEIRIFDANRGYDLQGNSPGTRLRSQFIQAAGPDGKLDPALEIFFDRLNDYVDGDDFARLEGREKAGYAEIGLADWPRNAPLRYREEIYWLDGVEAFLGLAPPDAHGLTRPPPPDALRLIPPGTGRFAGRPSFLSSTGEMIQRLANLTAEELQIALSARESWYREQLPLSNGLGDLYGKIAGRFNMTPGNVYTVEVRAILEPSGVSRRQVITVDTQRLFVGEQPAYLMYWEKLSY